MTRFVDNSFKEMVLLFDHNISVCIQSISPQLYLIPDYYYPQIQSGNTLNTSNTFTVNTRKMIT